MNFLPWSCAADVISFELRMPDDSVAFPGNIVSKVVYFGLSDFELVVAILPGNFKQLFNEEILDQFFSIRLVLWMFAHVSSFYIGDRMSTNELVLRSKGINPIAGVEVGGTVAASPPSIQYSLNQSPQRLYNRTPFPCRHIKAKTNCQIQVEASLGSLGSKGFLQNSKSAGIFLLWCDPLFSRGRLV